MKSLTLSFVVLLAATLVICQDDITTTVAPQVLDETAAKETTVAPALVESASAEGSPTDSPQAEGAVTESTVTEEKPKDEEKATEATEEKALPETKEEEVAGEPQPKEHDGEQDSEGAVIPPKVIFVTQHFRDPVTGVVYTRQVPMIPSSFLRPLPAQPYQPDVRRGQTQPGMTSEVKPQESSSGPSYDPLGQYNDQQKKRQFFQDMLMTQLSRFEKEIEPMLEMEQNVTEKNDMEELLGSVGELKRSLEHHQIFNITQIMNNWKQGKLADGVTEPNYNEPRQPVPPQGSQMPPQAYNRPRPSGPPVALRTLILVPQSRVMSQQQQPQYNPYPSMSRQVPMIHIRRAPYQPIYETESQHQQVGKPTEHYPQPSSGNEYSNNNEIFGY